MTRYVQITAAVVFVAALGVIPFVRGTPYARWLGVLVFVAAPFLVTPFFRLCWFLALGVAWWLAGFLPDRSEYPCPVCGYDVRETPHRCPECGTRLLWGQLPHKKG